MVKEKAYFDVLVQKIFRALVAIGKFQNVTNLHDSSDLISNNTEKSNCFLLVFLKLRHLHEGLGRIWSALVGKYWSKGSIYFPNESPSYV